MGRSVPLDQPDDRREVAAGGVDAGGQGDDSVRGDVLGVGRAGAAQDAHPADFRSQPAAFAQGVVLGIIGLPAAAREPAVCLGVVAVPMHDQDAVLLHRPRPSGEWDGGRTHFGLAGRLFLPAQVGPSAQAPQRPADPLNCCRRTGPRHRPFQPKSVGRRRVGVHGILSCRPFERVCHGNPRQEAAQGVCHGRAEVTAWGGGEQTAARGRVASRTGRPGRSTPSGRRLPAGTPGSPWRSSDSRS